MLKTLRKLVSYCDFYDFLLEDHLVTANQMQYWLGTADKNTAL